MPSRCTKLLACSRTGCHHQCKLCYCMQADEHRASSDHEASRQPQTADNYLTQLTTTSAGSTSTRPQPLSKLCIFQKCCETPSPLRRHAAITATPLPWISLCSPLSSLSLSLSLSLYLSNSLFRALFLSFFPSLSL